MTANDAQQRANNAEAHRNNARSVQRGGVSKAVNTRKAGIDVDPEAYLERHREAVGHSRGANDDHGPFADKWQAEYAHLPGVTPTDREEDERSNREKLLEDGEIST